MLAVNSRISCHDLQQENHLHHRDPQLLISNALVNADDGRLTEDWPLARAIDKWSSGTDDLDVTQSSYAPTHGDGLMLMVSCKPCDIWLAYLLEPKAREVGIILRMSVGYKLETNL